MATDRIFKYVKIQSPASGYKQVEYLKGDGTAYINLGWRSTSNYSVEVKYNNYGRSGSGFAIFGTRCNENYYLLQNGTNVYPRFGSKEFTTTASSEDVWNTFYIDASTGNEYFNGTLLGTSTMPASASGNIMLFARNYSDAGDSIWGGKIAYFKVWEGDTLVHNLLPCVYDDGTLGFYDTVTGDFKTNANTSGAFTSGDILSEETLASPAYLQSALPSGYTELDYVDCEAAQNFATGITINTGSNIGYEITTSLNSITGTPVGGSSAYFGCNPRSSSIMIYWNGSGIGGAAKALVVDTKYVISQNYLGDLQFKVDGTNYYTLPAWSSSATNQPIVVGAFNTTGAQAWDGKIYEVKISSGTGIVRDLIPAKDSKGNIGMYDIINGNFYTSTSGTSFIEGEEKANHTYQVKCLVEQEG